MELSLPHIDVPNNNNSPLVSPPPSKHPLICHHNNTKSTILPISRLIRSTTLSSKSGNGLKMMCLKERSSLVMDLERELEEIEIQGKEWKEMKNCKGNDGIGMVELIEYLEREAIMGIDEGREPYDYNRRAQIFHKSSKVFQALKELRTTQTHP